MAAPCLTCSQTKEIVISAHGVSREFAVMRFFQLQGEGFAPNMCENDQGKYTVCFNGLVRLNKLGASQHL